MIEQTNHPENKRRQHDSDVDESVDRVLKKVEAVLRSFGADELQVGHAVHLETGKKIKIHNVKAAHNPKSIRPAVVTRRAAGKGGRPRAKNQPNLTAAEIENQKDRAKLVLRIAEAACREVGHLGSDLVTRLLQSSDPELLVGVAQASLEPTPIDRVNRMMLVGAERFQGLIEDAGGSVSTAWVAQFLGSSEEAVRKRVQRNTLIARRTPSGELSFPRFQFDERKPGVLNGIQGVLSKAKSWPPEEVIRFLLLPHQPDASEKTPLSLLQQGELGRVLSLLEAHGEQRP